MADVSVEKAAKSDDHSREWQGLLVDARIALEKYADEKSSAFRGIGQRLGEKLYVGERFGEKMHKGLSGRPLTNQQEHAAQLYAAPRILNDLAKGRLAPSHALQFKALANSTARLPILTEIVRDERFDAALKAGIKRSRKILEENLNPKKLEQAQSILAHKLKSLEEELSGPDVSDMRLEELSRQRRSLAPLTVLLDTIHGALEPYRTKDSRCDFKQMTRQSLDALFDVFIILTEQHDATESATLTSLYESKPLKHLREMKVAQEMDSRATNQLSHAERSAQGQGSGLYSSL